MGTTKETRRERNGKYHFDFSVVCECGRPLGDHMAEAPYDLDDAVTQCEGFKRARRVK
jgi:hypothetical protein